MSAKDWECADCGVRVRFDLAAEKEQAASTAPSQPAHWVTDEDGWHCLRCQREAVLNAADGEEGEGTRAQHRRRALVEFELLREPDATDAEIARRARCTRAQVAPVRTDLVDSGQLRPHLPTGP